MTILDQMPLSLINCYFLNTLNYIIPVFLSFRTYLDPLKAQHPVPQLLWAVIKQI